MSRRGAFLALLALAWVATLALAPLVGSQPVDLGPALAGEGQGAVIVWQLRLPRVLLALLAGGILAAPASPSRLSSATPWPSPTRWG